MAKKGAKSRLESKGAAVESSGSVIRTANSRHDEDLARKLARLISRLESNESRQLMDKVALVLRDNVESRSDDIALCIDVVRRFYPERLDSADRLHIGDLFEIPKFYDMQRHRAHIQNDLGLFQATPEVQVRRRRRAESFTERYAGANEASRVVAVFADESGKTDEYLVFGSLWVYRPADYVRIEEALREWRRDSSLTGEFHYSNLARGAFGRSAIDFFARAITASPFAAFVSLVIPNAQLPQNRRNQAIYNGLGELLISGVESELSAGRIARPLNLTFCKDADPSADAIELRDMTRRIREALRLRYPEGDVALEGVKAMESHRSDFVQLADLYTGAVGRYLNQGDPDAGGNMKQQFASAVGAQLQFHRDGAGRLRSGTAFSKILYLDDFS